MREEAYLVVLEERAHAVTRLAQLEGYVGTYVHGASCILKAHGMALVGGVYAQLVAATCRGRVELRLEVPVVDERYVLLSLCRPTEQRQRSHGEQDSYVF